MFVGFDVIFRYVCRVGDFFQLFFEELMEVQGVERVFFEFQWENVFLVFGIIVEEVMF